MRLPFSLLLLIFPSLLLIVVAQPLNTQCDISESAIEKGLKQDQAEASAPKYCFSHPSGGNSENSDIAERCFYLLIPDCAAEKENVQLVVDLHDKGSCPLQQSRQSGWKEYALSECFVVAWPLGITDERFADEPCFTVPGGLEVFNGNGLSLGSTPDCCCTKDGKYLSESTTNDVSFLRTVLATAIHQANKHGISVNPYTVEITGYGNGATAALGFAALNSDIVACASSFSGSLVTPFPENYKAVPVFTVLDNDIINEDQMLTSDATMYEGTDEGNLLLPSASRTDNIFAEANGCNTTERTSNSNQVVDSVTGATGLNTGGRYHGCDAPVNFLRPPFADYKSRSASTHTDADAVAAPVNRVVDSTLLAMYFCKDKKAPLPAYTEDSLVASSARDSVRSFYSLMVLSATATVPLLTRVIL
jgi:poly(3-hydroxybutyrate) depolymerase